MKFRYTLFFVLGFISCAFLFWVLSYSNVEVPFGTGLVSYDSSAPSDWIGEEDIIVLRDRIILKIDGATLSNYAGTGSMRPLLDVGANGIRVVPTNVDSIDVGDIVSFNFAGRLVVHRVIEKGIDSEGVYFITQGDNNVFSDGKIRFEDIEYVTVGVIW